MKLAVNKAKYDIKVKVQFDINGGTTISETEKTYVLGAKYESLPTAAKSGGYLLQGWYTDPVSGTKITTDSTVDYNITKLYAHYVPMTNYTAFNVTTTDSHKDFGFYSLTKKSSSNSVFIDWGDVSIEELTSYSQVYHTYANAGNFVVKVSDDITQFCMSNSSSTCYEKVRYTFKSMAAWSTNLSNSLPDYCFYYCSAMNSLQNLNSITSIGTYCFSYCSSLTSFTGLGNITSLPTFAFYQCSGISSLSTLPTSVTSYSQSCLAYTTISDLSKIRSTDTLNVRCFAYMNSLRNLSTLAPRSSLPTYCFYYCQNLNVVDLSTWTSLTSIPSYCFAYCYNLDEVKLPNTVQSIGNNAFRQCYNSYFNEIALPSALTSIGTYAFYYCRYLTSISCYAENAPTVQSTTFGNNTTYYTGRNSYSAGTNTLYVNNPNNYNTSYWSSVLLDSTKCGYHAQSMNPYDVTYGRMEGLSSWYLSTGYEIVPEVSVYSSNGTLLTENVEWRKELSNNIEVGTAGISAVGLSPYYGCIEKTFKIVGEAPKMMALHNPGTGSGQSTYNCGQQSLLSRTFSFWAKYDGPHSQGGETYCLLFYFCGLAFGFNPTSYLVTLYEVITWESKSWSTYSSKSWHQYTITVSSTGQTKIYIDGSLAFTNSTLTTRIPSLGTSNYQLYLTSRMSGGNALNGYITRFAMWDRVLSDAEILEDYQVGKENDPVLTDMSHYYKMLLNSDNKIKDEIGNWNLSLEGDNAIVDIE